MSTKYIDRPKKPFKDFPLTIHPLGYFSKKVRGEVHFFGRWAHVKKGEWVRLPWEESWQAALKDYKARYDDASRSVVDEAPSKHAITLQYVCNHYLTAKSRKAKAGHITNQYVKDQTQLAKRLCKVLGSKTLVTRLGPSHFEKMWEYLSERYSPVRLGVEITRIKGIFRYALANELITKPVSFGSEFVVPDTAIVKRHLRNGPKKLFSPEEIRQFLVAANPTLRTAILLAINSGIGNADIARLKRHHINFESGWMDFPRGKTEVERHIPLWPETLEALKEAWENRPESRRDIDAETVLLTPRGENLLRESPAGRTDVLMGWFRRLTRRLGSRRKFVGFYAIRKTFATLALDSRDRDAVRHLMGHSAGDMLETYDEGRPSDERLLAVTNRVRAIIYGGAILEGGVK